MPTADVAGEWYSAWWVARACPWSICLSCRVIVLLLLLGKHTIHLLQGGGKANGIKCGNAG